MIANSITTLRIILIIIMSFFLCLNDEFLKLKDDGQVPIIIIVFQVFFIIAIITDFLDGYFARKFKQKTSFGKFFDPIADKLLVINSLFFLYKIYDADNNKNEVYLTLHNFFHFIHIHNIKVKSILIMVIMVIIIRDFLVTGIRLLASEKNYIIEASLLGKFKTAFTFVITGFLLFDSIYKKHLQTEQIIVLLLIIVVLTLISGINYLIKNFYIIKNNF
ncbi:CDP-diacylglycerol-3-phosphatidyltransferase [Candidatus Phytoplasma mali]|uniref:CDP-diacylglycerol-3-phosphatidyltransferase n=1 Tax=Phytoplasma mali (strain AT) TaxID=482235 RepID=B3R0F7_PHYMT|nr:CDP-alcohol phosphatidyltransferase family protein [Candidatus Phytoplasma mali]CAP18321.1 CDP-diacylglycerol-3-phosphatidyltransferase [Candidatus Phytoplasma mali]